VFDQATECATGIAQKTVPLSGLRRILLPVPPLAEQRLIAAKVDELMGCDQLEALFATARTNGRRFLEAVLHEALASAG
jgi:type I restriction enzyme S subunit